MGLHIAQMFMSGPSLNLIEMWLIYMRAKLKHNIEALFINKPSLKMVKFGYRLMNKLESKLEYNVPIQTRVMFSNKHLNRLMQ